MNRNQSFVPAARDRRLRRVFACVVAGLLVLACGNKPSPDLSASAADPRLDPACHAYLDAYTTCLRHLSPQSPAVAEARADNARAALLRISDPAQLNKSCVAGLAQLHTSCP